MSKPFSWRSLQQRVWTQANALTAADLMTRPAVTIGPDELVTHAARPTRRTARRSSPASNPQEACMSSEPAYALLADGSTVQIRPAEPADLDAVRAMHRAMSPDNAYLRFFSLSQVPVEAEADRVCRPPGPGHAALLALRGDAVAGCASYEPAGPATAEVAFAVSDQMHHKGIATLLLEHLASRARAEGIKQFTAETLAENSAMQRVFADAGLPVQRRSGGGVVDLTIPLPHSRTDSALDSYLAAVAQREGSADAASLRHLFAPQSVVVVTGGQRPAAAGRAILENICSGGYEGRLYAVHPHARHRGGVTYLPSVTDLPEAPDLAVIAVSRAAVTGVAEACGMRGVRALVVISTGLDAATSASLLASCRRHGMRLVGPGSLGIAVPGIALDATLAARHPEAGIAGLVMQSGGLGLAMANQLSRLGIGISSFASVGGKLDVSSNDLLQWWEQDGITKLAILYTESFGNPRKFARTARRVAATMPVLTVQAGVAASAGNLPLTGRQTLFEQLGIIVAAGLGELAEVTAFLATQPVPRGRSVAIVSNVSVAGTLAADACERQGLVVHQPGGETRRRLHALSPPGGTVTGPVDLTTAVSPGTLRQCLEVLSADEDVHAIIALCLPTAVSGDLTPAVWQADVSVPLAAVLLDQAESVRILSGPDGGRTPAYASAEAAAGALARAAAYGAWRAEPKGCTPDFADVTADTARALTRRFLAEVPGGGWLPSGPAGALLACYGLTAGPGAGPALDEPGNSAGQSRRPAFLIGIADDHNFGRLITVGLSGPAGKGADRAAGLPPLTAADADRLIGSAQGAPHGDNNAVPGSVRDLVLRVSQLAEDLPEVVALEIGPVTAGDGAVVADARVEVRPREVTDPLLRRMR